MQRSVDLRPSKRGQRWHCHFLLSTLTLRRLAPRLSGGSMAINSLPSRPTYNKIINWPILYGIHVIFYKPTFTFYWIQLNPRFNQVQALPALPCLPSAPGVGRHSWTGRMSSVLRGCVQNRALKTHRPGLQSQWQPFTTIRAWAFSGLSILICKAGELHNLTGLL